MTKLTKEQMIQLAFKGSDCSWQKDCMEKFIGDEFGFYENNSKFFSKPYISYPNKITHNHIIITRKTLHNWRKKVKLLWETADTSGFEDACWEDLSAMKNYGIRDDFGVKLYEIWNKVLVEWAKCGIKPDQIQKPSYSLLFWAQFLLMYHPSLSIFDIAVISEEYVHRMKLFEAFKEEKSYEPGFLRDDIDFWLAYRPYEGSEKLKDYEYAISTKKITPLRTPWLDQVFRRDVDLDRFNLPSQLIEKFFPYQVDHDVSIIGVTGKFLIEEEIDHYVVTYKDNNSAILKSIIQKVNSQEFSPEIQSELNEIRRRYQENDY